MPAARALALSLLILAPAVGRAEARQEPQVPAAETAAGAAPAPSAEALALAARYLKAARAETILDGEGPVVARYMLSKIPEPEGPGKAEEVREAMIRSADAAVKAAVPAFLDESAAIYARVFSVKELRDIVAFYESASGRAFVAKTTNASAPVAELIRRLGDKIQVDARKRFCATEPESCKSATQTSKPGG